MKRFFTAFSLECKKVFSSRGFWIFAIVIFVLCIIITASFRSIGELIEGMDDSAVSGGGSSLTPGEAADLYQAQLDEYLAAVESGQTERKLSDTQETYLRNMIAICRYCEEKGIDMNKLVTFGSIGSLNMSAGDYVMTMSQVVFAFVAIMAIVLAAKNFSGEIDDGTMRMQLTRPIKRGALLSAKYSATFVASMTMGIVFTVFFMVIGALFFDGASYDVLLVDAYQNVAIINTYTAILLLILFNAVLVAAVIQFTMFTGAFVNKTGALAIPLVLYLFADTVAAFLYNTGLPFVGLFTNLKWTSALTPAGAPIRGMSIYTMMAVTLVWFAGMMAVNHLAFEKRDLK